MVQIENYKDLKDSVSAWLNRKDSATVDKIPMFINFAEKQFTRLVKMPYYEAIFTEQNDGTKASTIVPKDLLSVKHMFVNGFPYNRVDNETFYRMKNTGKPSDQQTPAATPTNPQFFYTNGTLSRKNYFTRVGEAFYFLPDLQKDDYVEMIYSQDIPEMILDTDCPYSLLVAPDVMLYLALRHASIFIRDNEQEQYWMQKAQEAADSMNKQLDEVEWSGSALVVPFFDE